MQISQLLLFLILFPLITAVFMLAVRREIDRSWIVRISAVVIGAVLIYLLVAAFDKGSLYYQFDFEWVSQLMFGIEMALALVILYLGIKYRKSFTILLIVVQP